jgi:hypothetical protein
VANVMVKVGRRNRRWRRSATCSFHRPWHSNRSFRPSGIGCAGCEEAGGVAEAKGVNIVLDQQLIADVVA